MHNKTNSLTTMKDIAYNRPKYEMILLLQQYFRYLPENFNLSFNQKEAISKKKDSSRLRKFLLV